MKKIIAWLQTIEERAFLMYELGAKVFADDSELKGFLLHLAEEERLHYDLLKRAEGYLKDSEDPPAVVSVDDIKGSIERPFIECAEKARAGTLTKRELLRYITVIEYSELNNVFLYLIDSLKRRSPVFEGAIENIEMHKGCIEKYLRNQPDTEALLKTIKELPKTNRESILVVDDKPANVNLLKAVLEPVGTVEGAYDGLDALKKVMLRRFSAVVTDIDMPRMSGTEFYARTAKMMPALKERFVFYTATQNDERMDFIRANNLRYLIKPAPISAIRRTVKEAIADAYMTV